MLAASRGAPSPGGARDGSSERLRVLVLIDSVWLTGGAERFAFGLATHLPRERFDVWICATRRIEPAAAELLEREGLPYLNLGRRGKWDVHRFRRLIGLLRAQRFDILHAHMFGSNVWGVTFGRLCRVPVIIAHEHNWAYTGPRARIWIDRELIARFATRFVAVSEANRRRMIETERIAPEKLAVLPTARLPHEQGPPARELRAELGLPSAAQVIFTAAVFRPEKALEVLLDAHARVRARRPDAHLVLAGDGPRRAQLERQLAALGTAAAVHLLGFRNDIDSLLSCADVAALSSDWEGLPLFALECMAAGVPLVATAVGGVPEVVGDGATGLLVPPRDPEALAGALLRVLGDPVLARRLGEGAAARAGEFTIERAAQRFAALYEQLARGTAPRCGAARRRAQPLPGAAGRAGAAERRR
jgi:glycosyltransferase involved in cell wall biosynthesis